MLHNLRHDRWYLNSFHSFAYVCVYQRGSFETHGRFSYSTLLTFSADKEGAADINPGQTKWTESHESPSPLLFSMISVRLNANAFIIAKVRYPVYISTRKVYSTSISFIHETGNFIPRIAINFYEIRLHDEARSVGNSIGRNIFTRIINCDLQNVSSRKCIRDF